MLATDIVRQAHHKKQQTQEVKGVWLLIGDEVMVTKSGKETHGLGIFFLRFTTKHSLVCVF
jgi:hypothetical protein